MLVATVAFWRSPNGQFHPKISIFASAVSDEADFLTYEEDPPANTSRLPVLQYFCCTGYHK